MLSLANLLLPSFIVKKCITDENRRIRFYDIANIYIWILLWHGVVIGASYVSLDQCTSIFHGSSSNSLACKYFKTFIYVFVGITGGLILCNVIWSLVFFHFNKYKKIIKQVDNNEVDVKDNVFVLATLYKESKEEIEQMIQSVSEDNHKNICIVLVLDGEYCVDIVFNQIFQISHRNLQNYVNYGENSLRYAYHNSNGIDYLLLVKTNNEGKKHSHGIFYQMININNDQQGYMRHPLLPIVNYLNEWIDIKSFKYVLLLDGDTIIENNKTIKKMIHVMNTNTDYIAICGETHVLNKNVNIITMSQTFEYFTSHLLLKSYETIIFNTLVLSGCFSMIRLYVNDQSLINESILEEYNKIPTNLIEDNLIRFGEDRYLTSILLKTYQDFKIKYIPEINCYTNTPTNIKNLISQRQRWTNSLLACHIYLLKSKFISLKLYFLLFIELAPQKII